MSDARNNISSNSELIEYLKSRENIQTESEMKNVMNKIYESIALKSRLFYAFNSSIQPTKDEFGKEVFDSNAEIKPALIYSEKAEAYLPVYTTEEESQKRGNIEQFPYLKQTSFEEFANMVLNSDLKIEGIVLNPYTDNLMLSKSKIEHLLSIEKNTSISSKITGVASVNATSGTYVKTGTSMANKKKSIIVNEYDIRILEYSKLPIRTINAAIKFAKEHETIQAMWIFDKRYYLENDNMQYLAQLIVIEDSYGNEEDRKKLYNELKEIILPISNAPEVHVESIDVQINDFVRKNAILPFYQKINLSCKVDEDEIKAEKQTIETVDSDGWTAIEEEFLRVYPNQTNPKHYGALIKWRLGGPDPLDGISIYDAGDYWHFVTFGLSELYEKESENQELSGYGLEFTYKLKKGCYEEEETEIRATCNLLQQIAKIIVVDGEIIKPNEYLYTGQTSGIDSRGESKITGFITASDKTVNTINTKNGKVEFVELIGATDSELKAIMDKRTNVRELAEKFETDVTDYKRDEIII